MNTVKDILDAKGWEVWSIGGGASVYDALQLMAGKNVGALVVLDEGRLVGIVSERDYARKVILAGRASKLTSVQEVTTRRVLCVGPERTVEECMALMTDKHIRHLPVVDERGTVIGVISIGDIVKAMIAEQKFMIDQLVQYISGPVNGG